MSSGLTHEALQVIFGACRRAQWAFTYQRRPARMRQAPGADPCNAMRTRLGRGVVQIDYFPPGNRPQHRSAGFVCSRKMASKFGTEF